MCQSSGAARRESCPPSLARAAVSLEREMLDIFLAVRNHVRYLRWEPLLRPGESILSVCPTFI